MPRSIQEVLADPNLTKKQKLDVWMSSDPEYAAWANANPQEAGAEINTELGKYKHKEDTPQNKFNSLLSGYQRGAASSYQGAANVADLFGMPSAKRYFEGERDYRLSQTNPDPSGIGELTGESIGSSPRYTIPLGLALLSAQRIPGMLARVGLPLAAGNLVGMATEPIMQGLSGYLSQRHRPTGEMLADIAPQVLLSASPMLGALKNLRSIKSLNPASAVKNKLAEIWNIFTDPIGLNAARREVDTAVAKAAKETAEETAKKVMSKVVKKVKPKPAPTVTP